jgi:Abortive infection C-terminus
LPKIPGPLAGLVSSVKLSERSISAIADVIHGRQGSVPLPERSQAGACACSMNMAAMTSTAKGSLHVGHIRRRDFGASTARGPWSDYCARSCIRRSSLTSRASRPERLITSTQDSGTTVTRSPSTAPESRSIKTIRGSLVEFAHPRATAQEEARGFLDEQLAKCDQKLREGDYDGAVTNARSLTEAVLLDIERELSPVVRNYDGDLLRLFKRVQKLLELDPARPDVETTLKQILSGLASIVAGLGGTSNKMGDRHARSYKPAKRHAVLIVDSAKTLANFLIGTLEARRDSSARKGRGT